MRISDWSSDVCSSDLTIGPGRRAQVGAAEFCPSQGHWCGEGSATCAAVPGPHRPTLMAAARIDKVGVDTLHLAQVRIGEDLMRAFLIGIAVAAIGWENGGLAAEAPLAARRVPLISMGATSPQIGGG